MNEKVLTPLCIDELKKMVATYDRVLPVGNQTKVPLGSVSGCQMISLSNLSGMLEYEPSEFTFTAQAGSKVSDVEAELQERGQYLPFDPVLGNAGATLGGTIASGLSGPGRFRFGGIRDFCIGLHWMDGEGRRIRGGGKVVKNAAGFDFPKFMVGSLGRFGVLVDVTFKVFPRPFRSLTWCLTCSDSDSAMNAISEIASSRLEVDALDYRPESQQVAVRLSGPSEVLPALADELQQRWVGGELWTAEQAQQYWNQVTGFTWSGFEDPLIVKVPLGLSKFLRIEKELSKHDAFRIHLSVGGNLAWIAVDKVGDLKCLSDLLRAERLPGLIVLGSLNQAEATEGSTQREAFKIGLWPSTQMEQAVKKAMDPLAKFPGV